MNTLTPEQETLLQDAIRHHKEKEWQPHSLFEVAALKFLAIRDQPYAAYFQNAFEVYQVLPPPPKWYDRVLKWWMPKVEHKPLLVKAAIITNIVDLRPLPNHEGRYLIHVGAESIMSDFVRGATPEVGGYLVMRPDAFEAVKKADFERTHIPHKFSECDVMDAFYASEERIKRAMGGATTEGLGYRY